MRSISEHEHFSFSTSANMNQSIESRNIKCHIIDQFFYGHSSTIIGVIYRIKPENKYLAKWSSIGDQQK